MAIEQDERPTLLDVARRLAFILHRTEREAGLKFAEDRPVAERCDRALRAASRGGVVIAPGAYSTLWNLRAICLKPSKQAEKHYA